MTQYFKKLPVVYYNNTPAKNIMARADLSKYTKNNSVNFYPHTMEDGDRVDVISQLYYEDPDYTWLIYYANDILDPYYDVVMDEQSFLEFIDQKYGSLSNASTSIKYYKNNWAENLDQVLEVNGYEALPANLKKYWSPINDANFQIAAYRRKQVDWIVITNRVIQLNVAEGNEITVGDTVSANDSATGFVTFANSSVLTVQSVTGEFTNTSYEVTSRYSNLTANVTSVVTINENLDAAEEVYYSSVSFLDFEEEQNRNKKEIRLIDERLAQQATAELRRVFKS